MIFFFLLRAAKRWWDPEHEQKFSRRSLRRRHVSVSLTILICDTDCWTEPRPATTGNVKNKKSRLLCQNALGAGIGSKKIIVLSESRARRNGAALCRSQTQQQIHCKQWLFCPTTNTKMGFRSNFFTLQRETWFMEFCYCSHSDPIQWRAGAASVPLALNAFFALLPAQSQPQLDWCLIDPLSPDVLVNI